VSLADQGLVDHEQYVVDLAPKAQDPAQISPKKIPDISKWFHYPSWKRVAPLPAAQVAVGGVCMIFADECGIGEQIEESLEAAFWEVIVVKAGVEFSHDGPLSFTIRPGNQDDYHTLLQTIADKGLTPTSVIHLWSVTSDTTPPASELAVYQDVLDRGFMSVFYLAPALNAQFASGTIRMCVVSSATSRNGTLPSKAARSTVPRDFAEAGTSTSVPSTSASRRSRTRPAAGRSLLAEVRAED
jgi:hypothetical protein